MFILYIVIIPKKSIIINIETPTKKVKQIKKIKKNKKMLDSIKKIWYNKTIENKKPNNKKKGGRCNMEKMTNVKALEFAIENGDFPTEVVEKLTKMRDAYANKSGNRKPTTKQVENEALKADILAILGEDGQTATQIYETIAATGKYADLSLARVTAALTQMYAKGEGTIDRIVEKRKPYFKAR